jgi:hypothetical protein
MSEGKSADMKKNRNRYKTGRKSNKRKNVRSLEQVAKIIAAWVY